MPFYQIYHSTPLSASQQDALAQHITAIHTSQFNVPALFVNVNFTDYGKTPHYVGGQRHTGTVNMVLAHVRTGPGRERAHFQAVCERLEKAWNEVVVGTESDADQTKTLGGVFVLGGIVAAYEQGLMVPEAGQDQEWLRENAAKMIKLANGGNTLLQQTIEELKKRPEFKDAFASA